MPHPQRVTITGISRGIPLNRIAQPGDIADAIVTFASRHPRYITGQIINTDGGD